jgi:hypothetical protein
MALSFCQCKYFLSYLRCTFFLATARVIKPFGSDKKDGGGWWWWGLAGLVDAILEVGCAKRDVRKNCFKPSRV